jgi:tetratricopeptide (TPR) repeat protein
VDYLFGFRVTNMKRIILCLIAICAVIVVLASNGEGTSGEQAKDKLEAEKHLRLARSLFEQRRFAEAAVEAVRARQADPDNLSAWKLSGLSLQLAQHLPEAEEEFHNALKSFSTDADLWFYLARVHYLQAELKPAGQAASKALELMPDHADAHLQLGMVYEAQQDFTRALMNYERSIELNRQQRRPLTLPLLNAGQLLAKLGRFAEALEHLTAAVTLAPQSIELRLARGRVLERLNRIDEAKREYERAVALGGDLQARSHLERLRAVAVKGSQPAAKLRALEPIRFRNDAAPAGLSFTLKNSASPRKYQVETMPGGVAVLDYNNDGWPDIYFVNGAELPSMKKSSPQYSNRLFHNNRDGSFTDVTAKAGVSGEGYGMGAAVSDYDNDGDQDLFVAGVNRNILFQNQGDGTFRDVTASAGLEGIDPARGKLWSVAAAWVDYDNDGKLDLFVANYCKWNTTIDPYCGDLRPGYRTYCFPAKYEGLPNQLFRNLGNGAFADVSNLSGIAQHIGKGMGVAVADFNDDGFTDIFVANDTVPNFLFQNDGRGGFREVALQTGVAVNESGAAVSSMGVDFRDYDNDGQPDLIVTALEGETFPLFRNLGKGFFGDETFPSGLGAGTLKRSGWGLGMFDFNNDGFKDLFTVNSHVNDNIELYNEQTYRQSNAIFANLGNGTFQDVSSQSGADFQGRQAHRGCAFADFNNDGKLDVVTTSLNEPAELFHNESPGQSHWLTLVLVGTRSNRDGLGARIKLTASSGATQFNHATTSVGYASSSDRRVHFGLAGDKLVRAIEIRWPSGTLQVLKDVRADQVLTIKESATR